MGIIYLPFRKEVIIISNEIKELLRKLERQEFTVEKTKKNHYKVFKDGRLVATCITFFEREKCSGASPGVSAKPIPPAWLVPWKTGSAWPPNGR